MAKNAGQTVQALLAKAPAPPRAQVPPTQTVEPAPVPGDIPPNDESVAETAPTASLPTAETAVSTTQSRRRSPSTPTAVEPSAPPTLRLSQPAAEALRSAWLAAKRDRVLLTYQDFAGEVITAGLQQRVRRPAVDDKSSPVVGSSVPRTLRLSQPAAEALRSAWLAAKRDRVLLTYQDFAGEVITAGLQQH